MHINQDPIVGAQEKKSKFWKRIADHFKAAMFEILECQFNPMKKVNPFISFNIYIYIYICYDNIMINVWIIMVCHV